jgi:hypothetical protein
MTSNDQAWATDGLHDSTVRGSETAHREAAPSLQMEPPPAGQFVPRLAGTEAERHRELMQRQRRSSVSSMSSSKHPWVPG